MKESDINDNSSLGEEEEEGTETNKKTTTITIAPVPDGVGEGVLDSLASAGASNKSDTAAPSKSVKDGKNANTLNCTFCPSKIMPPNLASYHVEEKTLPKMKQKKDQSEGLEVETLSKWFVVNDILMFDNIGVSKAVGEIKYLTCADCEMGPVGVTDLSNKMCYIALERVRET